jgi:hypothetical protein
MISMTYARTLADGGGLVWFPGAPRVEGFTNPLWTLGMAALHSIGLDGTQVSAAVVVVGCFVVLGSALLAGDLVALLGARSSWAPPVAVAIVATTFPFVFWTLAGVEAGLIAFLSLLLVRQVGAFALPFETASTARLRLSIVVISCIGLATRLDFLIVIVGAFGWLAIVAPVPQRSRVLGSLALPVLAFVAAMELVRFWYYASWVPNTYTLKVAGVEIGDRITRGLLTDLKLLPLVALAAVSLLIIVRDSNLVARRVALLFASVAGLSLAYSTWVGGDLGEQFANRYVLPGVLLVVALAVAALDRLTTKDAPLRTRTWMLPLAFSVASFGLIFSASPFDEPLSLSAYRDDRYFLVAAVLSAAAWAFWWLLVRRPRAAVAAVATGVIVISMSSGSAGWVQWAGEDQWAASGNRLNAERGEALRQATAPDAVIAFSVAGAPAYWADRDSLDLLGKSDATVAKGVNRVFYPGHNKWDYGYSVLQLKPDVVTEFVRSPDIEEIEQIRALYSLKCVRTSSGWSSIWVHTATRKVLESTALGTCPGGFSLRGIDIR